MRRLLDASGHAHGATRGLPGPLRQLFGRPDTIGPAARRVTAIGPGVFAAVGQSVVFVVALYRGADLGLVSIPILGIEVAAVLAWVVLLARWIRSS